MKRVDSVRSKKSKIRSVPILRFLRFLAELFAPMAVFFILNFAWISPSAGGWSVMGGIGSLFVGIALCAPVRKRSAKERLRWLSLGLGIGGGLLIAISELLMYRARFMSGALVPHYVYAVSLFCLSSMGAFYAPFRYGMDVHLRRAVKIGKARLKQYKKGMRNFWWYEAIHRDSPLGALYHLNKSATLLFGVAVLTALFFGFLTWAQLFVSLLGVFLWLIVTVMALFALGQTNLQRYGKLFVWFRKNYAGKYDCLLEYPCMLGVGLGMACLYAQSAIHFFLSAFIQT